MAHHRRVRVVTLTALAAVLLLVTGAASLQASAASAARPKTMHMLVTLYGWPDNSPPGADIAYPVIHQKAGGVGTWQNPVTFATDKAEFKIGTKLYVPEVKRYFIMEDDCVECDQDWTGHGPDGGPRFRHIDLWVGGTATTSASAVIACEDKLTMSSGAVIVNPSTSLPVTAGPIFNPSTGTCNGH